MANSPIAHPDTARTLVVRCYTSRITPGSYLEPRKRRPGEPPSRTVLLVLSATLLHTSGTKRAQDRVRLTTRSVARAEVPAIALVHAWPTPAQPMVSQSSPHVRALGSRGPPVPVRPTDAPGGAKRRKKSSSIERRARRALANPDPVIPAAQQQAIHDDQGQLLRAPTAVQDHWRDPDDNNPRSRRPREITGCRRYDALRATAKRNPHITDQHLVASGLYQLAWELGPGGARLGYEPTMMPGGNFGPSSGPDEAKRAAMRAWHDVQTALRGHHTRDVLGYVCLENQSPTGYARLAGWSVAETMGYLIAALDQLTEYYRDEIRAEAVIR